MEISGPHFNYDIETYALSSCIAHMYIIRPGAMPWTLLRSQSVSPQTPGYGLLDPGSPGLFPSTRGPVVLE